MTTAAKEGDASFDEFGNLSGVVLKHSRRAEDLLAEAESRRLSYGQQGHGTMEYLLNTETLLREAQVHATMALAETVVLTGATLINMMTMSMRT